MIFEIATGIIVAVLVLIFWRPIILLAFWGTIAGLVLIGGALLFA